MFQHRLRQLFTENISYKMVSLFIALILWLTILGRRDFTVTKNFEIEVQVAQNLVLQEQNTEHIKVKVTGPRTALKKFIESGVSQLITLDLSSKNPGMYEVEVPMQKIDLPFGVKIVSVKPSKIKVQIGQKE